MNKHVFRFKQFDLKQEHSAQKMGTDSMLLGAWADPSGAMNILDIGTGTGVLALMMAQKNTEALVDAVEPDPFSAREAQENFEGSPWAFRLTCYPQSIQEFSKEETLHYDCIISNPPYFEEINTAKGNNLQQPGGRRKNARTSETLSHADLISSVSRLLVSYGRFYVVLPFLESASFEKQALENGLFLSQKVEISSFENEKPIRNLLMFCKENVKTYVSKLSIYKNDKSWSDEYVSLTRDFHLLL